MSKNTFNAALLAVGMLAGTATDGLAQTDSNHEMRTLTGGKPDSKLSPVTRKKRLVEGHTRGPSIELDRAARRGKEQTRERSRQLLLREIRLLKRVLRNMR